MRALYHQPGVAAGQEFTVVRTHGDTHVDLANDQRKVVLTKVPLKAHPGHGHAVLIKEEAGKAPIKPAPGRAKGAVKVPAAGDEGGDASAAAAGSLEGSAADAGGDGAGDGAGDAAAAGDESAL